MFISADKVYIWPVDGIAEGETITRDFPLIGYFAVKFGRGGLERAMHISRHEGKTWCVKLDGFLVAPAHPSWKHAFGKIYERALTYDASPILIGRRLSLPEYTRLVRARAADKERGIDLYAADLNSVEIPSF